MSNIGLIIEERSRDIGNFLVGRFIPFRKKRMVGPFSFIDHMGPSWIKPGKYMDVGQHPHIGLSTLTYLLEGQIVHRDSTGAVKTITSGSVGWMTAGQGIVHTERTPEALRDGGTYPVHGFQIWVALPKHLEDMEPEFSFTEAEALPRWSANGLNFTLVAGKGFGYESPVPVYSDLFMIKVEAQSAASFALNGQLKGEIGICVVEGHIHACGERIEEGQMLISKEDNTCDIEIGPETLLLLFGGPAFPEPRYIDWNFVSSDPQKIEQAKANWRAKAFRMVPGETDYVPLPEPRKK
ncbi:MAG: pirin family protein [Bacteroidota bacterium]